MGEHEMAPAKAMAAVTLACQESIEAVVDQADEAMRSDMPQRLALGRHPARVRAEGLGPLRRVEDGRQRWFVDHIAARQAPRGGRSFDPPTVASTLVRSLAAHGVAIALSGAHLRAPTCGCLPSGGYL